MHAASTVEFVRSAGPVLGRGGAAVRNYGLHLGVTGLRVGSTNTIVTMGLHFRFDRNGVVFHKDEREGVGATLYNRSYYHGYE